jgi:hypothetical protein
MEEALKRLKDTRSRLKAKITTLSGQLSKQRLNAETKQKYYDELVETHNEFLQVHNDYCGIVSDDKYASHRIVSGMDPDEYLDIVNIVYNKAESSYIDSALKLLCHEAELAITKAEYILDQVDAATPNQFLLLSVKANSHRDLCKELYTNISTYDSTSAILGSLNSFITKLDCVEVQCAGTDKTPSSVHFNLPEQNPLHNTSSSHSYPAMASQSGLVPSGLGGRGGLARPGWESTRTSLAPGESQASTSDSQTSTEGNSRVDSSIVSIYRSRSHSSSLPLDSARGSENSGSTRRFKFEKTPLPTFNGDRRAWPEFRSVWRMYAHSEFSTDKERAWALKRCLKGEALDCVGALYSHHDAAYSLMLQRLEDRLRRRICEV